MNTTKPYFTLSSMVISILFFLCSLSLNAQTDSLQGRSYKVLVQLYEDALFRDATDAKTYAIAANRIATNENDAEKIGWSTYYIAYADSYIPLYKEGLAQIERSIEIAEKLDNNLLLFKNYILKGNILSETKNQFIALDQYKIAKKYADLTNDVLNEIAVAVNIAYIKKIHKDHTEAIAIYKENLTLLETTNTEDPRKKTYKTQILFNLADCFLRINKPKEAKKYNNMALEICDPDESPSFYHLLLMNDAIAKYQEGAHEASIKIAKKAVAYYTNISIEEQLVVPYFYLGKNYFKLNQYQEAIQYLEKMNDIITRKKIIYTDQKESYEILYKSYHQLDNSEKANENFELYLALDKKTDSIDISVNNKIHNEHDIIPLKEEISSLDKKRKYWYGASALLLLSLIASFIWYKRKQQQNKIRFQKLLVTIDQLERSQEEKAKTTTTDPKEASTVVNDENALQILQGLETFEEKEWFLRQDCTLGYVAKKLKTNTSYLSNVINTYKERSFKSYLSELRINTALIRLKNDEKLRSYTIKAIAEEFGFKRSETFSRAFKAQTGMYPSNYIKNLDNQKNV